MNLDMNFATLLVNSCMSTVCLVCITPHCSSSKFPFSAIILCLLLFPAIIVSCSLSCFIVLCLNSLISYFSLLSAFIFLFRFLILSWCLFLACPSRGAGPTLLLSRSSCSSPLRITAIVPISAIIAKPST